MKILYQNDVFIFTDHELEFSHMIALRLMLVTILHFFSAKKQSQFQNIIGQINLDFVLFLTNNVRNEPLGNQAHDVTQQIFASNVFQHNF